MELMRDFFERTSDLRGWLASGVKDWALPSHIEETLFGKLVNLKLQKEEDVSVRRIDDEKLTS